jgi:DNA polymerase-3 subunit epsilon
MTAPGAAVLLDTETTDLDGVLVEVAVADACTGAVLLDTLVYPGERISVEALAVHGISEADIVDAPALAQVLPRLLEVTRGRTTIAYNAEFDSARIAHHAGRDGLDLEHLGSPESWACLMQRHAAWRQLERNQRLDDAGHRARKDVAAALVVLRAMAAQHRQEPADAGKERV